ncbi:hypothetical protein AALB16_09635 [Lachnospiraceae bacterium 62-35]
MKEWKNLTKCGFAFFLVQIVGFVLLPASAFIAEKANNSSYDDFPLWRKEEEWSAQKTGLLAS